MCIPVRMPSFIRQVMHSKFKRLDVNLHGLNAQASYMEIVCIKSTIQTTAVMVRTRQALIWKLLQLKCDCTDAKATQSGRDSNQERISANLKSRSYSCPSGCPMSTVWMAPRYFKPDALI
jgi:hypothetical protein